MEEVVVWIGGVILAIVAIFYVVAYALAAIWVFLAMVCNLIMALLDWALGAGLTPQAPFVSWVICGGVFGGCLGFWTIAPVYGLRKLRPALIWVPLVLMGGAALVSLGVQGNRQWSTPTDSSSTQLAPAKANRIKVAALSAAVRVSPRPGTTTILRLRQASVVEKIGWDSKYDHIRIGGKEGWIHQSYVREVDGNVPLHTLTASPNGSNNTGRRLHRTSQKRGAGAVQDSAPDDMQKAINEGARESIKELDRIIREHNRRSR